MCALRVKTWAKFALARMMHADACSSPEEGEVADGEAAAEWRRKHSRRGPPEPIPCPLLDAPHGAVLRLAALASQLDGDFGSGWADDGSAAEPASVRRAVAVQYLSLLHMHAAHSRAPRVGSA